MRIAYYAPLKAPTHPTPSGDRRMARLFIRALTAAGHSVDLASDFRAYDGSGDPQQQVRIREQGGHVARTLIEGWRAAPASAPELWFTYHVYHKAPDWLGPAVADGLGIPYVIAEASHAPKRRGGAWDLGYQAAAQAIGAADTVLAMTRLDLACLEALVRPPHRLCYLPPFIDAAVRAPRERRTLAPRLGMDPDRYWLLSVAMMRPGDKLASYRLLAESLGQIAEVPWTLRIYGDGPARSEVEEAFAGFPEGKIAFCGAVEEEELPELLAACDLCVWPAVNEAYGMALLEAEAAGVPVVAGRSLGVPAVVADGETGLLVEPNDAGAFAAAVKQLLDDPARRAEMGRAAAEKVRRDHGLEAAARTLDGYIQEILPE